MSKRPRRASHQFVQTRPARLHTGDFVRDLRNDLIAALGSHLAEVIELGFRMLINRAHPAVDSGAFHLRRPFGEFLATKDLMNSINTSVMFCPWAAVVALKLLCSVTGTFPSPGRIHIFRARAREGPASGTALVLHGLLRCRSQHCICPYICRSLLPEKILSPVSGSCFTISFRQWMALPPTHFHAFGVSRFDVASASVGTTPDSYAPDSLRLCGGR
jgi:hypothetical protein